MLTRLLTRPAPAALLEPPDATSGPVRITWLGTAGFTVETPGRTLVLDPYVTRASLFDVAFRRLVPSVASIDALIPEADDVLIGHSHFDHILDAPHLCRRTGARFIGSASACQVARAGGVAEDRIVETRGREDIACGADVTARALPSAHGRIYFKIVPLSGEIPAPPAWPPRNRALRHGLVLNWHLDIRGPAPLRILHIDSAEFFADEVREAPADVVCLCAIGRNYRPGYVEEVLRLTGARTVIPCHWDLLSGPLAPAPRQLPGVDLQGMAAEIRDCGATPVILPPLQPWSPSAGAGGLRST